MRDLPAVNANETVYRNALILAILLAANSLLSYQRPYCTNKSAAFFIVLTYIVSKNSSVFNTNDSAAHIRENFPLKRALLLCIIKATKKRRKNTENHRQKGGCRHVYY